MFHLVAPIDKKVIVAVSGGPDSMAVLSFCVNGRKNVTALYVDHLDEGKRKEFSDKEYALVEKYCLQNEVTLVKTTINRKVEPGECKEAFWSEERNKIFHSHNDIQVITGHNLNDAVEWWLLTSLKGNPKLMSVKNGNVFRPFLTTPKQDMIKWCQDHSVPFVMDPTNFDGSNDRSKLRAVMPALIDIQPGLLGTVAKRIASEWGRGRVAEGTSLQNSEIMGSNPTVPSNQWKDDRFSTRVDNKLVPRRVTKEEADAAWERGRLQAERLRESTRGMRDVRDLMGIVIK